MRKETMLAVAVTTALSAAACRGQVLWTTAPDFGGSTYAGPLPTQSGWFGWDVASSNGEAISFEPADLDASTTNGMGDIGNGGFTSGGGALTIDTYQGGYDQLTTRFISPLATGASTFISALTQSGSNRGMLKVDFTSPLGGTTLNTSSPYLLEFMIFSNNATFTSGYVDPSANSAGTPNTGVANGSPGATTVNNGSYFTAFIPYSLAGAPTQNPYSYLQFGIGLNSDPAGPYANKGNVTIDDIEALPLANTYSIWTSSTGGSWSSSANWSALGVPGSVGDLASFLSPTASGGTGITGPAAIALDANRTLSNLNFDSAASYTLSAGTGGVLTMKALPANSPIANITDIAGQHSITAPVALASDTQITVSTAGDTLTFSGGISGSGGLAVAGPGVTVIKGGANTLGGLIISSGSTLDLTNGAISIHYGTAANDPRAALVAKLIAARNGGFWNGVGLTSSNAAAGASKFSLGYADGNVDIGTPAAANQFYVAYTLASDANLDGSVGFPDLVAVAQSYGFTAKDWAQGNFTYDPSGSVSFADLVILAQQFGLSTTIASAASPAWHIQPASVIPEPASLSLVALGAAAILPRRGRKRPP